MGKKSKPCVLTSEQQAMVTKHILLVGRVLKVDGTMGLEYDDAFQIGALGLMRAAAFYRPEKGVKFSTYATTCIKRALAADLRARLTARHGHGDKPLSLDYKPESGRALGDTVPVCTASAEEQLITRKALDAFKRVVGRRAAAGVLSAQAAQLYWIDGLTQEEVAARIGKTKQYVNQLVWKEMRRFRTYWM